MIFNSFISKYIVGELPGLTVAIKRRNVFKSCYSFGGRCQEIRHICMDSEPCLKVHSLISVHHQGIKLGQMIHLNVIVHVVVSNYRLVKIRNSPQFIVEPRNGRLA